MLVTASTPCSTASAETICGAPATLREGGRVVTYGFQSKMRAGRMASGDEGRHPIREFAELGWFIVPQLVQARPKEHGAVHHPMVVAVQAGMVPS